VRPNLLISLQESPFARSKPKYVIPVSSPIPWQDIVALLVANQWIGRYISGNDTSFDDSSNERITHPARYAYMASRTPRRLENEVLEGNLIDLDSPPPSPNVIKLEHAVPQFRTHTEETAAGPKAPAISMTTQATYSTSSQSQRGHIGPVPDGISSRTSRRPSPRSNGAMSRAISAKASFYAGLDADCKRFCPWRLKFITNIDY
jgi:hypothetical protein